MKYQHSKTRNILILTGILFFSFPAFSQPLQGGPKPTIYSQVDEVRKELGLDHSQFEKVYKAYEKYNKAVFGDEGSNGQMQAPPSGGRPGGRPPGGGGFGGPGGGMGGPGGGMSPREPGGNPPQFNGNPPVVDGNRNAKEPPSPKEIEKMQKNIKKQEEKLDKTMQKLFKKEPQRYSAWQQLREKQLKVLFPQPPEGK